MMHRTAAFVGVAGAGAALLARRLAASTTASAAAATLTSSFDGGNGELISCHTAADGVVVFHVAISKDPFTPGTDNKHHYQWFQFSLSGVAGKTCSIVIDNASEVSYPSAWGTHSDDGGTVAKFDAHFAFVESVEAVDVADASSWQRARGTVYDSAAGTLSWTIDACEKDTVVCSFFPHYSEARHLDLVADCAARIDTLVAAGSLRSDSTVRTIATTVRGRAVECVVVAGRKERAHDGVLLDQVNVWIICRQHPGEPQAEWWADGFLRQLLATTTAEEETENVNAVAARELLQSGIRFFVVPNMNPDGSVMGHLRTNSVGANLNREWAPTVKAEYDAPTLARSPSVLAVLRECDDVAQTPSIFLDVHADEELPFNFICGPEGCPCWNDPRAGPPLRALHEYFGAAYRVSSGGALRGWNGAPYGYGLEAPNEGNMHVCSNQIAERYSAATGCLGITLEQPFKDVLQEGTDPVGEATSATPTMCREFGRAALPAIRDALQLKRQLAASTGALASTSPAWSEIEGHLELIRAPRAFDTAEAVAASDGALAALGDATREAFQIQSSDHPASI